MKLALPPIKDCKYAKAKLKIFYEANKKIDGYPNNANKEFERALWRLFRFFQLPKPKITWMENFGVNSNTLGKCTIMGEIQLITPFHYEGSFESWLDTFYHEVGHYVLWSDTERKATEFAKKMMRRK